MKIEYSAVSSLKRVLLVSIVLLVFISHVIKTENRNRSIN